MIDSIFSEQIEGWKAVFYLTLTKLKDLGINVVVVWGCEIKEMMKSEKTQRDFIKKLVNIIIE